VNPRKSREIDVDALHSNLFNITSNNSTKPLVGSKNNRRDYISEHIKVKRNQPGQLTVHLTPFSYSLGGQFKAQEHTDTVDAILSSVFIEL
jgi:hypothetical protein